MRWPTLVLLGIVWVTSLGGPWLTSGQRRATPVPNYFRAFQAREDHQNLTRVVLRNGLTILIEEHPLDPLTAIGTYVRPGSSHPSAETLASARLLESLHWQRSERVIELGKLGASLDVRESADGSYFSSVGPAENAVKILEFHAALLSDPQIDATEIAPELRLLQDQEKGRVESQSSIDRSQLATLLYPDFASMLLPPTLTGGFTALEDMGTARRRLSEFQRLRYHPKNVILVVSGQARREQILEKVVELYGALSTPKDALGTPTKPSSNAFSLGKPSFQYLHLRDTIATPRVVLGYRVPGPQHEDHLPLLLLSYMLGQGRVALLQPASIDAKSPVRVEVGLEFRAKRGLFYFALNPPLDRIDRAEVEILAQLEMLKRDGVPVGQLHRGKALLLKDHYMLLQELRQRAYGLAVHEGRGSYRSRDNLAEQLSEISEERLKQVVLRYFTDTNLALIEHFPDTAEARTFTAQTLLESFRLLVPAIVEQRRGSGADVQVAEDNSTFHFPEFIPTYLKYPLKRTSVLRGPTIYFQQENGLPLVHMGLFYGGGRDHESGENAGLTELMLRALFHQYVSNDESQSWAELERVGAEVRIVNEADFFGFTATALSAGMNQVFSAMIDRTRTQSIDEDDLLQARLDIQRVLEQGGELAVVDSIRDQLFGGHAYGLSRYGSEESRGQVTLDILKEWLTTRMGNVHPLIVIRGDFQGTAFLQEFVSKLSDSRYQVRPLQRPERAGQIATGDFPATVVGSESVTLGFPGPAAGSREVIMLDVLESALNGSNGLLAQSLRNRSNLLRRAEVVHQSEIQGGLILVRLMGTRGQDEPARQGMMEEFEELARVPIQEGKFLEVLVGAIAGFHIRQQRAEHHVVEVARNLFAGGGVDYRQKYLSGVKNTRADDLSHMTKRYFLAQPKKPEKDPVEGRTVVGPPGSQAEAPEDMKQSKPKSSRPSLRKKQP